ncbi:hypothetical protein GC722_08840 [Auraticoccus sp. F435]|uniref:TOMM leader peptide-binding protein n=1 Tax=Auraticoccus cholistanensis TaxID=2656650 RepID=A0A6A9UXQ8_9ACTN|nr:hypothetical protein [Auraticoccus cholistanensis]MVA76127.1 hypothetical protein [Auraticoccus cholistanensis]
MRPPVDDPLPPHPRLRSGLVVVPRDGGEVQLGVGPDAVLLQGADDDLVQLVARLDGTRSLRRLREEHPRAAEAVAVLARHGMLEPVAVDSGPVLVVGAGRLGRAIALRLADAGVPLLLCDPEPPQPGLYPDPPRASAAASLRALLEAGRASGPWSGRRRPVVGELAHWSERSHPEPRLAVVALDRVEPDRGLTDHLLRRDVAHLLVRPLDGGARVGPLVLPGQSCCTRCTDLYRRRHDPGWPRVLAQLVRRRAVVPELVADWCASVALPSLLAARQEGTPDLLGRTLDLDVTGWTTRLRRWPAHPGCGCDLQALQP